MTQSSAKERDTESGLDYFGARYYGSALGRFTSPDDFKGGIVDPFTGQDIETNAALPYADITDPLTLNKYAYVRNNPLRYTDPDGHCAEALTCTVEGAGIGEAIGGPFGAVVGGAIGAVAGVVIYKGGKSLIENFPSTTTTPGPYVGPLQPIQASQTGQSDKPYEATPENADRMKQGKAPVGKDGKSVELHHDGQKAEGELKEMTQTDHRGGDNYAKNHQNTGQGKSQVNRSDLAKQRHRYWKKQGQQQDSSSQ